MNPARTWRVTLSFSVLTLCCCAALAAVIVPPTAAIPPDAGGGGGKEGQGGKDRKGAGKKGQQSPSDPWQQDGYVPADPGPKGSNDGGSEGGGSQGGGNGDSGKKRKAQRRQGEQSPSDPWAQDGYVPADPGRKDKRDGGSKKKKEKNNDSPSDPWAQDGYVPVERAIRRIKKSGDPKGESDERPSDPWAQDGYVPTSRFGVKGRRATRLDRATAAVAAGVRGQASDDDCRRYLDVLDPMSGGYLYYLGCERAGVITDAIQTGAHYAGSCITTAWSAAGAVGGPHPVIRTWAAVSGCALGVNVQYCGENGCEPEADDEVYYPPDFIYSEQGWGLDDARARQQDPNRPVPDPAGTNGEVYPSPDTSPSSPRGAGVPRSD